MKLNLNHTKLAVLVFIVAVLLGTGSFSTAKAENIDELKEQLQTRKESLKNAESKIERFKEEIQIKRKEAKTLEEQISIIEDNIAQIELSIAETVAEIEVTNAEIKVVKQEIDKKMEEISHQKDLLAEYIRIIYKLNRQSTVTVFLKYSSFSEAMNEASTIKDLQERSHLALMNIKDLKEQLENKMADLNDFKEALENLQKRQEQQQSTLAANRQSKEQVLELTKEQEQKYQELLKQSKVAHQQAEADIKQIDSLIREELKKQGVKALPDVGVFDWPINPIFGVSCEFRCADYPYAYLIGPHTGMDIPTYVGTPILAPADGYVARVHDASGPGYSYLMIVHGSNISTVYGHLSGFAVSEGQMITRGSVIGYTGGAPGTNGAGLSTGPHLHFEVRQDNVAINPRNYL